MTHDPFRLKFLDTMSEVVRQKKTVELAAQGAFGQTDSIKRMMEQIEAPGGILRHLRTDPHQDTVSQLHKLLRNQDGWSSTMRAIEEAHRQRDLVLQGRNATDLLRQRERTLSVYLAGIGRTAELIHCNRDLLAEAATASRSIAEIAGMTSSIVRQMEALKLSVQMNSIWPKPLAEQYTEQLGIARRAAEEFGQAETEEHRSILLVTLFVALVGMMRAFRNNTKREVLGLSALVLLGAINDVVSLLPSESPAGMSAAQVQVIEDTRREVRVLQEQFSAYRDSEDKLDEAWIAELPRAELKQGAMIRDEAGRHGRVLAKLQVAAPLAVMGTEGRWKQVAFRDPLTDDLAKGWVYSSFVNVLD